LSGAFCTQHKVTLGGSIRDGLQRWTSPGARAVRELRHDPAGRGESSIATEWNNFTVSAHTCGQRSRHCRAGRRPQPGTAPTVGVSRHFFAQVYAGACPDVHTCRWPSREARRRSPRGELCRAKSHHSQGRNSI